MSGNKVKYQVRYIMDTQRGVGIHQISYVMASSFNVAKRLASQRHCWAGGTWQSESDQKSWYKSDGQRELWVTAPTRNFSEELPC